MKDERGFSVLELIIVVSVMLIIAAMVTLNFRRMNEKYQVEANTKDIYAALMRARNDAATTNTSRLVSFGASQISSGPDADGNGVIDGTAVIKKIDNRFTINFTATENPVIFDRRGLTNNNQTIRLSGYGTDVTPASDCLILSATRINIGKWNGSNCVQ